MQQPNDVIQPGSGRVIELRSGDTVRIEQTEGGEVADVICYSLDDTNEQLSCTNTIMYNFNLDLVEGSSAFSNRSRKMLRMRHDTLKSNNLILGCCTLESFQHRYGLDYHPSCHETFVSELHDYGLADITIPPPINFFMNWPILEDGTVEMGASPAKPGDFVELEAEMDLLFVLSVCAQELTPTNNYRPTALALSVNRVTEQA